MIIESLCIYSQNVQKNKALMDLILETCKNSFDIILIQEPPRFISKYVPSPSSANGEPIYSHSSHPEWTTFSIGPHDPNNTPRSISYINKHLSPLQPKLRKDIIEHRDINITSLTINHKDSFILNVYSDDNQSAINFLRDHETNLSNVLVMAGDFNIHDHDWDPLFPHHSSHVNDLITIANSLNLELSTPINPGPTCFADNNSGGLFVIDLLFLNPTNPGFNNHSILPDKRHPSDHAPLSVEIQIGILDISIVKRSIKQGSEEESDFISHLISNIATLNSNSLVSHNDIESFSHKIEEIINTAWFSFSKEQHITKHSKEWWNQECSDSLSKYRTSGLFDDWKSFKQCVKKSKSVFFEEKIHEIATTNKRPWDLMNWVKQRNLPAVEAIKFDNTPCTTPELLWTALHQTYNAASNHPVNLSILHKLPPSDPIEWPPFSAHEFTEAISKYSNSSAPGPDHLSWHSLKALISDERCMGHIIHLANACIDRSHWPTHFKASKTIIIPKPQKALYDMPKSF